MCGHMTIAIGINFGAYILLAADTRTTLYGRNGRIISYTDESVKIQKTSMGLITGAGSTPLLNSVNTRLSKEKITNTDQILRIIFEERQNYQGSCGAVAEQNIKLTGLIFTYKTVQDSDAKLRLGIIHPSLGNKIGLHEENCPALISPFEATEEDVDSIVDFLKKAIKPFREFTTLSDSIQYHWLVIAKLIQRIQPAFPSISSYCQIGVHALDGLRGISSVLKDTDLSASINLTGDLS